MIEKTLHNLGWSDKQIKVYLTLLKLGPSPVRTIGTEAGINRGTTYDILKALREEGVVAYFHKKTRQYFVAEDPEKLLTTVDAKKEELSRARTSLEQAIPQMRSLHASGGQKPVSMLYEGLEGVRYILNDVLARSVEANDKSYYAYSSADVRSHLYSAMPKFNDKRKAKNISVKVIGFEQGETHGLDERKTLHTAGAPSDTYMFIYAGRVAYVSADASGEPVGMIVENEGIHMTQKRIFESLWECLPNSNA